MAAQASAASAHLADSDTEDDLATADADLQPESSEMSAQAPSAKASPHQGLSHEQYKKLKRHKKKNQPTKAHKSEVQFSTSCATCGWDCKSRNKLFAHLKSTGHAALK